MSRYLRAQEAKEYLEFLKDDNVPNKKGEYIHPTIQGPTKGFYTEGDGEERKWIAFDNTTGECWVEEFYSIQDCVDWLNLEPA